MQPGTYSVRLTAGGRSYTRPLHIVMDPRVTAPAAAIARQYALASRISAAMDRSFELASRSKRKDPRSAARYRRLNGELARMLDLVEAADAEPTAMQRTTAGRLIGNVLRGDRIPTELRGTDEP
ncbi:MAG: hypothetical protein IAI49_05170 [Candidatus Eremiobacteraeota bacterium]|nr:hypothetical protein [Candidatus Eremiobacteraeota bacterium]